VHGRFLSRDPMGYLDSMNLYSFVNNNLVCYTDPYGLAWYGDAWKRFDAFCRGVNKGIVETGKEVVFVLDDSGRVVIAAAALASGKTEWLPHNYGLRSSLGRWAEQENRKDSSAGAALGRMPKAMDMWLRSYGDRVDTYLRGVYTGDLDDIREGGKAAGSLATEAFLLLAPSAKGVFRAPVRGPMLGGCPVPRGVLKPPRSTPRAGFGRTAKGSRVAYLEYKALRLQGYRATEAFSLMKQFRAGRNPGGEWAFHFTTLRGGKGIVAAHGINTSRFGVRGTGVYMGEIPTPSWTLKHVGWGLGRRPVRIPVNIRGLRVKPYNLPPRTVKYPERLPLGE